MVRSQRLARPLFTRLARSLLVGLSALALSLAPVLFELSAGEAAQGQSNGTASRDPHMQGLLWAMLSSRKELTFIGVADA